MTVRLVVDIQNRLFWRIGIGRILSAVLSLRDGAEVHEMGIDVPAEQRLQGFEPLVAADRVVLIAAPSPSQQKDRCLVQTSTGSVDGFTASRSYPRPMPLTSTYAVRGSVPRRGRGLCARGHRAWSTDAGGKPVDGGRWERLCRSSGRLLAPDLALQDACALSSSPSSPGSDPAGCPGCRGRR